MVPILFLLLLVPFCLTKSVDITFKNATFRGYSIKTEKFKRTIAASNSLKDFLPESPFDEIDFQNQTIPVLYEGSLADLDELDELVIEFCEVYEIRPGALKNVPLLRRLSLKGNKIEEIKKGVFNTLEIATLDLSLNFITTIHSNAFDDMPGILNIKLSDNKIAQWNPDWFKNTPLLTRISMQNNSITELPSEAFKNLAGEKKFGKVDLTINLVLSHNAITKIDTKAFIGLEKINNLWLDNNYLESFNENLLENIEVKDLRLNDNKISCFEEDYSKVFKAETTHIDGNPFDCDCFDGIKAWVKKNNKNVDLFFSDMECSAQRIKKKMVALEKRLKEIRFQDADTDEVKAVEKFNGEDLT